MFSKLGLRRKLPTKMEKDKLNNNLFNPFTKMEKSASPITITKIITNPRPSRIIQTPKTNSRSNALNRVSRLASFQVIRNIKTSLPPPPESISTIIIKISQNDWMIKKSKLKIPIFTIITKSKKFKILAILH